MVGQLKSSWVTSFEMIECIRNGGLNKYLMRLISFFRIIFIYLLVIIHYFISAIFHDCTVSNSFSWMGFSKPITINWVRVVFINSSFFYLTVYIF